ncbi:SixA phosphatase family protein [Croceitalea sp. MTPC5]|uniref:SixA phosphatase family protein n=1 Tax=Croceitalea sp. MTPC5 TaxID=3056565 RepID=UPI0030CF0033
MLKSFFPFFIFLGLLSCNTTEKSEAIPNEPTVSSFYLIRHAEKDRSDSTNIDPELMQKGLDRAIRWAEVFDDIPLDVIYSTNYERTRMTAAPTSVKKDIDIDYYDPRELDFEAFKAENVGLNVLIVGHSNTTPQFVNELLGQEKYGALEDTDNSSLFIVTLVDSVATDIHLRIN